MIAGMALRARERKITLAIIGFCDWRLRAPHDGKASRCMSFRRRNMTFLSLNAWSVAGLTAFPRRCNIPAATPESSTAHGARSRPLRSGFEFFAHRKAAK